MTDRDRPVPDLPGVDLKTVVTDSAVRLYDPGNSKAYIQAAEAVEVGERGPR